MTLQGRMRLFTLKQAVPQFSPRSANKRQKCKKKKIWPCENSSFQHACICVHHMLYSSFCYLIICEVIPWGLFAANPDFPTLVFRASNESIRNNIFSVPYSVYSTLPCRFIIEGLVVPVFRRESGLVTTPSVIQFRVRLGFSFLKFLVILVVYDLISDLKSRVYLWRSNDVI